MPIVFNPPESGLGQGIKDIGSVIGNLLNQRTQYKREALTGQLLQQALQGLGESPSASQYASVLSSALSQGASPQIIQQFAPVFQRMIESERKAPFKTENLGAVENVLSKLMPPEQAKEIVSILPSLSTGGQTQFANFLFDKLSRSGLSDESAQLQSALAEREQPLNELVKEEEKNQMVLGPVEPFKGLTPKERVSREKDLYKDNLTAFKSANEATRTQQSFDRDYQLLENLNNSGKLPKGLFKNINVSLKEGKLRAPALANPETQQYVKTINQFLRKAKDFFGSRVTNFDVQAFMQTLPTLANSTEGRRVILDQMKTASEIIKVYDDNLLKVYKHYGLRGIDEADAIQKAEQLSSEKIANLEEKFLESTQANQRYIANKNKPPEHELMLFQNKYIYVPKSDVEKALKEGAKLR